jgi:Lrp/AsnC family transcriptional regulator
METILDETDRRILRALQNHPDMSIADLAAQVGMSHTPLWRRLKRLESEGVILGRSALLDPAKLDLSITVFANIRLKQHDEKTLEDIERVARSLDNVVECFSMSGDSDYIFRIVVSSIEEYESFLKKTLLHLPGVASVNSHFALKCIKLSTKLPI